MESSDSDPESSVSSESCLFEAGLASPEGKDADDEDVEAMAPPPPAEDVHELIDSTTPDLSQSSGIVMSLLEAAGLGGGGGGGRIICGGDR